MLVNSEGGEAIFRNENGDTIIVPRNRRNEAMKYLLKDDHHSLDKLALDLPKAEHYASGGTVIPEDPIEGMMGPETTITAKRPEKSIGNFLNRWGYEHSKDPATSFLGAVRQGLGAIAQLPQAAATYMLDPKGNVKPGKALTENGFNKTSVMKSIGKYAVTHNMPNDLSGMLAKAVSTEEGQNVLLDPLLAVNEVAKGISRGSELINGLKGSELINGLKKSELINDLGNKYLPNAYKLNPNALKEAQEQMLVRARPIGQDPYINMAESLKAKEAAGEQLKWYQKNLLNPQTNPNIAAREKYFGQWFADNPSDLDFYINPGTRNFADDAQIEILKARMPKSEASKYSVKNFEDAKKLSNLHDTEFILPKDMVQQLERHSVDDLPKLIKEYNQINKPHWLKGYKQIETPKTTQNFKSEIDWSKWNKEIPENKKLIQEYNLIEQQAKANGTWMKNPDGSTFKGTPEQFVQQNSENFKKAFGDSKLINPDGSYEPVVHSTKAKFDEFDKSYFGQTDEGYHGEGFYFSPIQRTGFEGEFYQRPYKWIDNKTVQGTHNYGKNKMMLYVKPDKIVGDFPVDPFTEIMTDLNKPGNIKSAIGNNGMFDMNNPNIFKGAVNNTKNKQTSLDFSSYPTPTEAAKLRAERLLSQEHKMVNSHAIENLKNIDNNFEAINGRDNFYNPASLGKNTGKKAIIYTDSPLSVQNQAKIAAHEVGHFYRNSFKEGQEWNSFFNFEGKGLDHKTKKYFQGKGMSGNGSIMGDEIKERAAQLKDFIAHKNNIPLNKDFTVTEAHLDDAIKNYVKETGLDNNMTKMLSGLVNKKGFLKAMNNKPLAISAPIVAGALANKKTKK